MSERGPLRLAGSARVPATAAPGSPMWRTASALAASLVAGLLIGSLEIAPTPARVVAGLVQSERDVDSLVAALQNDGVASVFDEDLL